MSLKTCLPTVKHFSFGCRTILLPSHSALLMPSRINLTVELRNSTFTDPDLANVKPFADIPGIKGIFSSLITACKFLPVIGEFRNGIERLNELHKQRHELYGDIYRIDLFGTKLVMVHDPDDIRKVYRHEGQHPHRIMLHGLKEYRDNLQRVYPSSGILTENGIKWFNIRSQVQVPMLRPQIVETYLSGMDEVSEDFIKHMKGLRDSKKEIPNYLNELYKWALESIGLVAFNTRLGCLNAGEQITSETQLLIKAVGKSMENVSKLEFGVPLWKYFPSRAYKEFCEAQDFIFKIALKYFNQTIEEIQKNKDNVSTGGILGVYIRNRKLDEKEIRTFMMDLLQAGIDTTSHTMAFTLYLLARNPEKQDKAFEEIQKVLSATSGKVSPNEMPYVRACIKESLRMMAVVEGTMRILDQDIVLSGYHIPAGVPLILLSQVASRFSQNFQNPLKFVPERWLGSQKPHPYSNLPFGHGPRMCIGRRIAMQEIHLLLTKIIQNFKIEYNYEDIKQITRFVSIPDKPLKFSFIDRDHLPDKTL